MTDIILVGDIMLGRSFNDYIFPIKSLNYPWGNTLSILKNSDIVIGNLETTITNSNIKWPNKTFNYKLLPKYAATLKIANLSYCSLANNHIFDYRMLGLKDTIKNLDKLKIKYAGVGKNLLDASAPTFIIKNNIKIGFLSAADHYHYWAATNNTPGLWYISMNNDKEWEKVFKKVRETKRKCHILIFSLHWNYNYVNKIDKNFIIFAHKLIDNGVDIIHGHSPHHLLPIEKYKNRLIFYSLGDFIDDYAVDPKYRNDLAIMVKIVIQNGQINIEKIYPTHIKNMQVNITNNIKDIDFIGKQLYTKLYY